MSEPLLRPPADPTPAAAGQKQPATPVPPYEKPVIRKYDQIDQVRPYGPSEI